MHPQPSSGDIPMFCLCLPIYHLPQAIYYLFLIKIYNSKIYFMKKRWHKKIPIVILIATAATFALSGAVMLLWNNVLAAVLHVGMLSIWQAMGILVLSKILFGGFRGRRGFGDKDGWRMRKQVMGKWQNMTDEEKEIFKSKMRHSCGRGRHSFGETADVA